VTDLAIHDFDEIGVPPGADAAWRRRANEEWSRRALDYQAQGIDLLLAGQTPLREFLEAPSALLLEAISACLLDCDDETRIARLRARGSEWFTRSAGELQHYLNWAEWLRSHARERHVRVIDTSALSAERSQTSCRPGSQPSSATSTSSGEGGIRTRDPPFGRYAISSRAP
jgi:hypothetical protein